jgi:hypothetical protein
VILPPPETVTSIEFVSLEDGYTMEGPDGKDIMASEYLYRIKSSDDFQPECRVRLHVIKQGEAYRVLGMMVQSP